MTIVWRTMLRLIATRGRIAAVTVAALLTIVLGLLVSKVDVPQGVDPDVVVRNLVASLGLTLLVPLVSLALGAAAFGDLIEDGTLVYLWLKPIARWQLAAAVLAATLTLAVPVVVIPLAIAVWLGGGGIELVGTTVASAALASAAYSSMFVGFGLLVRRALAWGLGYVLIWEGIVASIGPGPAKFSIRHYAEWVLESGKSVGSGTAVLLSLLLAGVALTTLTLLRRDVP